MLEVEILRYNPGKDVKPYFQKFAVPLERGVTVLGVLDCIRKNFDESLAYKIYCTNQHCGECGVMLNGKPVLACHELITTDQVVLKPLARFPVVKDLVVDADSIIRQQCAQLPALEGTKRNWELLTEDEQQVFFMAGGCIGCSICQCMCPLHKEDQEITAGPAFYVALSQHLLRARTKEEMDVILSKAVEHGILKCTACKNCSRNCPKEIDPFKVISVIIDRILRDTNIPVTNPKLLKEIKTLI